MENWRLHYAKTLAAWNERFQAHRAEAAVLYDDRFCRMWEFYLQFCEAGFRMAGLSVLQLQLTKQVDAVPITRDYIYGQTKSAVSERTGIEVRRIGRT